MSSPTQRSLAYLRKRGYTAEVVERYNSFSRKKNDLYGCIDLVAMKEGEPFLGLQVTSGSNVQARIDKSCAIPTLQLWLRVGNHFVVHGWRLMGKKGKRKVYKLRVIQVSLIEDEFLLEETEG